MSTEVWYRKWRPQRFGDVAGQDHVTRTLAGAVANGRIAHAYLFCGPRGTGKTSTARILAKAANCRQNEAGEPCGHCPNCVELAEGRSLDLIEMDAASNRGIDEIRSLRDKVGYSPTSSAYKIYLIDEVHELTAHAFDALLKTLEEPPPHVIFILATTEAERVPATVASRCQRYDFRRIRLRDVVARLGQVCAGELVELPPGGPELVARRATGSLRDAVNLLEQVIAAFGSKPSLTEVGQALGVGGDEFAASIVRHALTCELPPAFGAIAAARDEGIEPRQLQRATLERLRAMMLVKSGAEASLELGDEAIAELRVEANECDLASLLALLRMISSADFRGDPLSPLPLELALARSVFEPAADSGSRTPEPNAAVAARVVHEPAQRRPPSQPAAVRSAPAADQPRAGGSAPGRGPSSPLAPAPARHMQGSQSPPSPVEVSSAVAAADSGYAVPPWSGGVQLGDSTLESLQGMMGTVYDRLLEQKSRARFFVNSECNIMTVDDQEVTLAFAQDFIAAKFKSDDGGNHIRDIEDVIESLSGRRYRLRVDVDPQVQRWRRPPATGRTSHLLDEAEKLGLRRATE